MANADEYWNGLYTQSPFKSGKAPNGFLQEMLPRLRTGKVLDIGMGEGANAVYLAQKGYTVKGFDLSAVAIEHAEGLARDTGVQIETKRADMDLYLFGMLEYDSVVMTYFKPSVPRYYNEIIRALKLGGTILVESLMIDELSDPIGQDEAYRDFYYKPNELLHGLQAGMKGMRILFYQESMLNGRHTVQCLAQKPMDKDVAKYGLFDMQTGPKDTGPSVHQKLAEQLFKKKS